LGIVYDRSGKTNTSIEVLERALSIDPKNPSVMLSLGRSLCKIDKNKAIDALKNASELATKDDLCLKCCIALGIQGAHEEALIAAERGLIMNPKNDSLMRSKKFNENRIKLKNNFSLYSMSSPDKEQVAICLDAGWRAYGQPNYLDALQYAEDAIKLNSTSISALSLYVQCLEQLSDKRASAESIALADARKIINNIPALNTPDYYKSKLLSGVEMTNPRLWCDYAQSCLKHETNIIEALNLAMDFVKNNKINTEPLERMISWLMPFPDSRMMLLNLLNEIVNTVGQQYTICKYLGSIYNKMGEDPKCDPGTAPDYFKKAVDWYGLACGYSDCKPDAWYGYGKNLYLIGKKDEGRQALITASKDGHRKSTTILLGENKSLKWYP
jgi:tetratricopeptide (TPR) repeat protein